MSMGPVNDLEIRIKEVSMCAILPYSPTTLHERPVQNGSRFRKFWLSLFVCGLDDRSLKEVNATRQIVSRKDILRQVVSARSVT